MSGDKHERFLLFGLATDLGIFDLAFHVLVVSSVLALRRAGVLIAVRRE
jgi:hypothetical protein